MTSRLTVDTDAILRNYRTLCEAATADVGAVVKADGYGLGARPISRRLAAAGCRSFFVASAAEGAALRKDLPAVEIFVFEGALPDTVTTLRTANLIPIINHAEQLKLYGEGPVAVHADTGMSRLGLELDSDWTCFAGREVLLLLTHLACADERDNALTLTQLARFSAVRERFPGVPVSIGNSAAILRSVAADDQLGRAGIALYGGNPFADEANPMAVVATFEGQVLQRRRVSAGASVGYGAAFVADSDRDVATLGIGYADGVPRSIGQTQSSRSAVMLGGERCPLLGRVSMDLIQVDVTGVDAAPGDWAEVFGPTMSVDSLAQNAGTLAYEVFTGMGRRVVRAYR